MYPSSTDVAIIGSGAYGLSLAAHLSKRKIEHRIFGEPMQTWASMSPGMFLKSLGFATNIYTARPNFTLPEYCRKGGLEDYEPIEIATFARYGIWVQQQLVPYVENSNVSRLEIQNNQFILTLASGERLRAHRVVVATGLSYFERTPNFFEGLPPELVSHTAQHGDFSPFKGQDVAVVGGGQSALQAAALLNEHGAKVRMIVRKQVNWGMRVPKDSERSLSDRIRIPVSVLGHGRDNWRLQHIPMLQHYLPTEKRLQYLKSHLGPGGAWWLRERVENLFPIHAHTKVLGATAKNGKISLTINEEGHGEREIITEHIIAGTGYVVDLDQMSFLSADIKKTLKRIELAPELNRYFQSSIKNLYFVGPSSIASFGPLFRFVAGAEYTVPTLARHLAWSSGVNPFITRRKIETADPEITEAYK